MTRGAGYIIQKNCSIPERHLKSCDYASLSYLEDVYDYQLLILLNIVP